MPTELKQRFQPGFTGVPPGMSREDKILWEEYRATAYEDAINVYFNAGVGGETESPKDTAQALADMWLKLTQKRIDVLIETEKEWRIIELRSLADTGAIGRLLTYKTLWEQDPIGSKPVRLILVTDRYDQAIADTAKPLGISYVVL